MTEPDPMQVLALPLGKNDADAATIRDYLLNLLALVWKEGEDAIKRPFGNSGWQYEVYAGLGKAGLITATFDEDGYLDVCDDRAGDRLMLAAIRALGSS